MTNELTSHSSLGPEYQRRLILLIAILALVAGFVAVNDYLNPPVGAFSSGPPPGYTRAPGEEPQACAECHLSPGDPGTGHISITVPPTYVPGNTYQITVTHTNPDPTRRRWGFELTALDSGDDKAGELQSTSVLTQVITGGPGGARQYIEHSSSGTFINQSGGASWTFNWTAPATDVGAVTFYAAGNHANNDGNTSGDYIYFTFDQSLPAAATPDFLVNSTPALQIVSPGNGANYNVNVTPSNGFTGNVSMSISGLPAGANGVFNPTSVNLTDTSPKSSTLTVTTSAGTPVGTYPLTITAISGMLQHTTNVSLRVVSPTSADISVSKTASPNPGLSGSTLTYRLVVLNSGPATATNVSVTDNLPAGITFVSAVTTQGSCSGAVPVNCNIGNLANGAQAVVTITVTPTIAGQITNNATVTATQADPDSANNAASVVTVIDNPPPAPIMLDQNLTVTSVVTGLDQPTTMAFLGANDFLVLERATGRVQRVVNGQLQAAPALDLAVNNNSERGLLGIAMHPSFPWAPYVYLYWTESSTGADSANVSETPVLGNRVDRYLWNGSTLTHDRNLIRLRAFQEDEGATPGSLVQRGNHNGGIIRFGPDGKLYIIIGDNGRRGFLQNVTTTVGPNGKDDQFGGPEPDDAHVTGSIFRLNDDGSTPPDNPFYNASTALTGQAAENIKKIYAYGIRNSFGMAFDPLSGNLWTQENGDDAFDEINRVIPGFNGGWVQIIGPSNRIGEYKSIETTYGNGQLQQLRWSPSLIANSAAEALSRLYSIPGSQYVEPQFSWKYALAPSPIGFVDGNGLGTEYNGNLFVGASRTTLYGGYLFRFKFANDRLAFAFTDARLQDKVADNLDKFDATESESILIGKNFGISTDIQNGPDGNLYVVSLSNGAVYRISGKQPTLYTASLNGAQETPPNGSTSTGTATILLSPDEKEARLALNFSGLSSAQTDAHVHGPAAAGVAAPPLFHLPNGNLSDFVISMSPADVQNLKNGLLYINVHSANFPSGEIRGQFGAPATASSVQFSAATYMESEAAGRAAITLTRLGNTSGAISVNYATSDAAGSTPCAAISGLASQRCDYQASFGTVDFSSGETSKTIFVPLIDDGRPEGNETLTIALNSPVGTFLGSPSQATIIITDNETATTANPILATNDPGISFFVRQQYRDFLGREPDLGEPWSAILRNCPNQMNFDPASPSAACDRITVSGSFFGSPEFLAKGVYIIDFYRVSFTRLPEFSEFVVDLGSITGATAAETNAKRAAFANNFVLRPEFVNVYGALTNPTYVNTLMGRYGLTSITTPDPANPDGANKVTLTTTELINRLNAATLTRAQVLRAIVQSDQVTNAEAVNAFVASQYYGYLRRTPEPAGYASWVTYMNAHPGDYRTMIHGFLDSAEYRLRFGTP